MLIDELHNSDPAFLAEMHQVLYSNHYDPHHFLGLHPFFKGKKIIRLFRPGAIEVFVQVKGEVHSARRIHQGGIFDLVVDGDVTCCDYQIYHHNGLLACDPYAFLPLWGEFDTYLLSRGVHYELYNKMGARNCS